jgi:hypothetical protein
MSESFVRVFVVGVVTEGLVTLETVEVVQYRAGGKDDAGPDRSSG